MRLVWVLPMLLATSIGLPQAVALAQGDPDGAGNPFEETLIIEWPKKDEDEFDRLGRDLLRGLRKHLPRVLRDRKHVRLAIWPFKSDDIPVSGAVAQEINDRLLASLTRHGDRRVLLVARSELKTIIKELEEISVFDEIRDPVAALTSHAEKVVKSAEVDLLVMGTIRLKGDAVLATYKLAHIRNAEILASTKPVKVAISKGAKVPQMSLDQAVRSAARYFKDHAAEMTEMHLAGVRYQASGAQPELGTYIEELASVEIQKAFASKITGRKLVVKRAEIPKAKMRGLAKRGLVPEPRGSLDPARPESYADQKGRYVLTGSYWELNEALEVRLSLKDRSDRSVSTRHVVRLDTIPKGVSMKPAPGIEDILKNDPGPIDLRLSSDRGPSPVYRIGDEVTLVIDLARPGWLYCFYRYADGRTFKILPNERHVDTRLDGPSRHLIPGPLFGGDYALTVREPPGLEIMKCFATTRDVGRDLPQEIQALKFKPLPGGTDVKLRSIFRAVPGAGVSEASMVVTVVR